MMTENKNFVCISPKRKVFAYKPYSEYLEHNGKWIVYGKKEAIEDLGRMMIGLVGKHGIIQANFTKNPALRVPEGFSHGKDHALIVYCDDRKRENVKNRLNRLGIGNMLWEYERETIEEVLKSKVHD